MRIAMITPVLGNAGGMGRVAEEYATRLAARGHEITLISPHPRSGGGEKEGVVFIRPIFRYGHGAWIPQLANRLRGFDVVHLHYPFLGGTNAVLCGIKKLKHENSKTRFVVSYHMDLVGSGIFRPFFRAYQKYVLPKLVRVADAIMVSSLDYAYEGDLEQFVPALGPRLIEIPFGVDISHFSPSQGEGERKRGWDEITFLFVGKLDRAHYFKGVPILLRAFAEVHRRHPSTRLNLVGSGDLMEIYRAQARSLGIERAVVFCGSVSPERLPELYQNTDCFVLPSVDRSEAFGLVLLEAQSCGVPVVASALPGVRTTLEPEKTGLLVEPRSLASLVEALEWMVTHPEERRAMGRAARTRIEAHYQWNKIIELLETIYKS